MLTIYLGRIFTPVKFSQVQFTSKEMGRSAILRAVKSSLTPILQREPLQLKIPPSISQALMPEKYQWI